MKAKDTLTEEAEVKAEAERIAEDCCNRTHPSMAGFRVLRSKTRRVTP